jgi:hypothetical protein
VSAYGNEGQVLHHLRMSPAMHAPVAEFARVSPAPVTWAPPHGGISALRRCVDKGWVTHNPDGSIYRITVAGLEELHRRGYLVERPTLEALRQEVERHRGQR